MTTTYKQQMKAVKASMKQVESNGKHFGESLSEIQNSLHWKALNDAYSTLAALAIMNIGMKPLTGNTIQELKQFTRKDLY